jgi:ABC-type transport system involved in multi-copper enzyme maturation permease subunit
MSTMTADKAPAKAAAPRTYRVTWAGVLRSELSKFATLRSSWITLALAMLFVVGFGILSAVRYNPSNTTGGHFGSAPTDAVAVALGGQNFGQLAVGVLGVLFMAGEYSTGMIRSTLVAVPRRLPVLISKAAVLATAVFILATIGVLIAFLGGEHSLADTKIALSLSSPGVIGALLGAGGYFALVAVIGVGFGALIRSVAGGIAAMVTALMLLPAITSILPGNLGNDVSPYLPSNAGSAMFTLNHDSSTLSPGAGAAVFAGWALLALGAAAYRLTRSDA